MASNDRKIIAIGGGEIGRPREDGNRFYPVETTSIDKEILRLTNKKNAKLIFIPTASNDSRKYFDIVKNHFLKIGFASISVLYLLDKDLTKTQIKEAILSHDAIYVGGGNTLRMMSVWRKLEVDTLLKQALDKGVVLSGISAGSICWFSQGSSDSRSSASDVNKLMSVTGLGFIEAYLCPHYDVEPHRQSDVKIKLRRSAKVAICLDNCVAIEVIGDKYRIIKSKASAKAHKAYWKKNRYFVEEIVASDSFKGIANLLAR